MADISDLDKAFQEGRAYWLCFTCNRKKATYVSRGVPICARCVWKRKHSQWRRRLWAATQL
jgi:hypothetical protein